MRTDYPKDYNGPKAGLSDNQEWLEVTEFQAYKYMVFGIWKFSDFDCWLSVRDGWHYNRGSDDTLNAFKEAHKIQGIS